MRRGVIPTVEWSQLVVADDCLGIDEVARRVRRGLVRKPYNAPNDDGDESLPLTAELKSGERHYLDGRPIHCGDVIEMQERVEHPTRELAEQGATAPGPNGHRVRYENEWVSDEHPRRKHGVIRVAVLYVDVGGYTFSGPLEEWARFRWPERRP